MNESRMSIPGTQFVGCEKRRMAKRQAAASSQDWCVNINRIAGENTYKQSGRKYLHDTEWETRNKQAVAPDLDRRVDKSEKKYLQTEQEIMNLFKAGKYL